MVGIERNRGFENSGVNLDSLVAGRVVQVLGRSRRCATRVRQGRFTGLVKYTPDRVGCILSSHFAPRRKCVVRDHQNNKKCVEVGHIIVGRSSTLVRVVGTVNSDVSTLSAHILLRGYMADKVIARRITGIVTTTISGSMVRGVPPRCGSAVHTTVLGRVLVARV